MKGHPAAVLLAAGKSRRMGCCKQLLPLGGSTVIGRCLETLVAAGLDEIVVVVSVTGAEVAAEAGNYPAEIVVNPLPDGDMTSSLLIGCNALSGGANAVLVTLCDHPLVQPGTVAALMRAHAGHPGRITIPSCNGRRGHPLMVSRPLLGRLADGLLLRDLVQESEEIITCLEVDDPGIYMDMDTPEEYRNVCRTLHSSAQDQGEPAGS